MERESCDESYGYGGPFRWVAALVYRVRLHGLLLKLRVFVQNGVIFGRACSKVTGALGDGGELSTPPAPRGHRSARAESAAQARSTRPRGGYWGEPPHPPTHPTGGYWASFARAGAERYKRGHARQDEDSGAAPRTTAGRAHAASQRDRDSGQPIPRAAAVERGAQARWAHHSPLERPVKTRRAGAKKSKRVGTSHNSMHMST